MVWIAAAVGAFLGVWVSTISWYVSGKLGKNAFWSSLPELTRKLASHSASDEFLKTYGQLLRLLGAYLGRNLLLLAISFSPVIAIVLVVFPGMSAADNARASALTVHPPRTLQIVSEGVSYETKATGSTIEPFPEIGSTGRGTTSDGEFDVSDLRRSWAWCETPWGHLGMELLGFNTLPATDATGFLILRPRQHDSNPLWPFLNDLEFYFYLGLTLSSMVTAGLLKMRGP